MEGQRALKIHNRLVQGALGGTGIEGISTILASLVKSTVVIEDRHFNMIVASVPRGDDIRTGIFPEWATPKEFRKMVDVKELLKNAVQNKRCVPVPAYPDIGLPIPSLIAPIIIRNDLLGYVSIYRRGNQEFTDLDFMACEQAAIVLALEMLRERTVAEVEERIKGDFFDDLFSCRFENGDSLLKRGRYLGYDLLDISRVIVIRPANMKEVRDRNKFTDDQFYPLQEVANRVLGALKSHSGEKLIGTKSDFIVLLVSVTAENSKKQVLGLAHKIHQSIRAKFPDMVVSIGIGTSCQRLEDYKNSFETARKCVEFLDKQSRQGAIMIFEDSGINRLIFSVENSALVLDFIGKTLGPLLEYDKANNTDLVGTLALFFENQFSQQKTAEDCFVHISTLRYRLQRAEEILDVKLNSAEQAFNLHVAIKAYEVLMNRPLTQGKFELDLSSTEIKPGNVTKLPKQRRQVHQLPV